MFHEVAHGLGIHRTIDGAGTVKRALREQSTALEEQKADVVGLFMLSCLEESGESGIAPLIGHHVAHLADLFRLQRYGGASPYALSAGSQLDFLVSTGRCCATRSPGRIGSIIERVHSAVEKMAARILTLQGDGDYAGVVSWYRSATTAGNVRPDIDRIQAGGSRST